MAALCAGHGAVAQSYTITDLGPGVAKDVNNSGHVVGTQTGVGGFFYDGRVLTAPLNYRYYAETLPSGQPIYAPINANPTSINDADHIAGLNGSGAFYLLDSRDTIVVRDGDFSRTFLTVAINNNDLAVSSKIDFSVQSFFLGSVGG